MSVVCTFVLPHGTLGGGLQGTEPGRLALGSSRVWDCYGHDIKHVLPPPSPNLVSISIPSNFIILEGKFVNVRKFFYLIPLQRPPPFTGILVL